MNWRQKRRYAEMGINNTMYSSGLGSTGEDKAIVAVGSGQQHCGQAEGHCCAMLPSCAFEIFH